MESILPPPRPRVLLQATDVTKVFGETVAVWDVTVAAQSGDLIAVYGANGSGKSTLLRILAGLMATTRGQVMWTTDHPADRPRVAYLGHATHLFDQLTVLENVVLAARLARRDAASAYGLLGRLGVGAHAERHIAPLSTGIRRRVGLARILVTDPDVILADEPMAGLDIEAAEMVGRVLAEAREDGRLVIVATHDQSRGQILATRVVCLDQGRLREPGAVAVNRHVV